MIKIYYLDAAQLYCGDLYKKHLPVLSQYRRNKLSSLMHQKDRALCLGGGLLLDYELKRYGAREAEMKYAFSGNGKPYFENLPELHFSISHSGTVVLAAFSDGEVGCDAEKIRDITPKLATRFFGENECSAIEKKSDPDEKNELFFRLWTLKESYMKKTGLGFALKLCDIRFDAEDGFSAKINGCDTGCEFSEYKDIPGYAVALCCDMGGERPPLEFKTDIIL